ncbi:MAG: PKD domain-containing protein [Pseudomonadota bacterium]|nr:PKD domain-containing protein [Pseudomonadota bacterium]
MRTSLFLALFAVFPACTTGDKDAGDTDTDIPVAVNGKPIAEAGESINQTADTPVALSGAASSDPEGDPLAFHWSFDHVPDTSTLATSSAPFNPNHGGEPGASFTADAVGTYVIKLTVTDPNGAESDPDYVIVTIEEPDSVPVSNAGTDILTNVGTLVALDGSLSYDPQGRTLTYSWSVVDKPTSSTLSTISGADTVGASFTPDQKGVYVLNLVVNNGLARSVSDAVTVTALGDDHAPVANAGDDQPAGEDCTTVLLDCSGSADPDGDPLQYMWEVQSKPTGSAVGNTTFSDRTAVRPTFYPDVAGEYVLSCAVTDGTTWSSPDMMTVSAAERRSNERPTITAGVDTTVDGGSATCEVSGYTFDCDECADQTVPLGSTATVTDADGDPLIVRWATDNADASIADPNTLVTTVTLEDSAPTDPDVCTETPFEFELTVTDCTGATVTDTVILTVSCCGVAEDTATP